MQKGSSIRNGTVVFFCENKVKPNRYIKIPVGLYSLQVRYLLNAAKADLTVDLDAEFPFLIGKVLTTAFKPLF